MLSQSRLDKISEMENLLNEAESFLADAEQFLEKWQAFLPKMKTLEHYYFDGDWREDYQAYEDGKIPEDMPCGVLSEDLVFNASTGHHSLAIEYLKVVTKVLDQYSIYLIVQKNIEKRIFLNFHSYPFVLWSTINMDSFIC